MRTLSPSDVPLGAAVFFHGSDDPIKAGSGAILSGIIEDVTNAPWSHCGYLSANGEDLFESTIWHNVSGPQWNKLVDRLPEYVDGGRVVAMPYLPKFAPNWEQVEAVSSNLVALRRVGRCPYAVEHLFGDLVDDTILEHLGIFEQVARYFMCKNGLVCSECLAKVRGLSPWIGATPAQLATRPDYGAPIQLIP